MYDEKDDWENDDDDDDDDEESILDLDEEDSDDVSSPPLAHANCALASNLGRPFFE